MLVPGRFVQKCRAWGGHWAYIYIYMWLHDWDNIIHHLGFPWNRKIFKEFPKQWRNSPSTEQLSSWWWFQIGSFPKYFFVDGTKSHLCWKPPNFLYVITNTCYINHYTSLIQSYLLRFDVFVVSFSVDPLISSQFPRCLYTSKWLPRGPCTFPIASWATPNT